MMYPRMIATAQCYTYYRSILELQYFWSVKTFGQNLSETFGLTPNHKGNNFDPVEDVHCSCIIPYTSGLTELIQAVRLQHRLDPVERLPPLRGILV